VTDADINPRVALGDNAPPPEPTPFDAIRVHIEDLYTEACNWADGEAIASQEQADRVNDLKRQIQEAEALADKERKTENKPFDDGKAEVQARYAPLISNTKGVTGKTVRAVEVLNRLLGPWLKKLKDEQEAEAKRLRDEAQAKLDAARAAAEAAKASTDIAVTEDAEAAISAAQEAARVAKTAEAARPRTGGDYGRASGLRDKWVITGFIPVQKGDMIVDGETALLRHYWAVNRPALVEAALALARAEVSAGKRSLPGVVIENQPYVV
jgi:hypothetical protein